MSDFQGNSEYSKAVLATAATQSQVFENNEQLEDVFDAMTEIENYLSADKAKRINCSELTTPLGIMVAELLKQLDEQKMQLHMGYEKLISWIVLEILNLGTTIDELATELQNRATLEEVVYGLTDDDNQSIMFFLKTQNYNTIRLRYNKLSKNHKFLKQKA